MKRYSDKYKKNYRKILFTLTTHGEILFPVFNEIM